MDKMITRRGFLKIGASTLFGAVAITACGDLFAMGRNVIKEIGEIIVGEDNFIIDLEELKEQRALNFVYKGRKSILLYNDGKIKAFENICTHKGGPSKLEGNKLVCQWHGAIFDPITGEVIKGPAPQGSRLTLVSLKEQEGRIYIDA